MRNINASLLAGLEGDEYRPCVLVSFTDKDEVYLRYTSWDQYVSYNTNIYYPRGMEFSTIKYGAASIVDNVTFKIDDVDRAIYSFLSSELPGSIAGSITLAVLDRYGEVLGATELFNGTLSEWSYSPSVINCKIASPFVQWGNVSTKVFSASCRWTIFKGAECKYSGDETECDRTYTQCGEYLNTDNFGGFRWTQSLEEKEDVKTGRNFVRWPTGSGEAI